jgi:rubrerythrin
MKFESVDSILDFAIAREEESVVFYRDLAEKMDNPHTRKVFELFSKEEVGHKQRLMNIKEDKSLLPEEKRVKSLNIADYLTDVEVSSGMSYQDALIVAMKKEKAAFKLYSDLSEVAQDQAAKHIFQILAQEEAKHKLRFEIEYDDYILTDN